MAKKDDSKLVKNPELLENPENELTEKELNFKRTKEDLFIILAKKFQEFYKTSKMNFSSAQEAFYEFLKREWSDEKTKVIEELEWQLWRSITFSDIKDFYLKSSYTIEWELNKKIFKDFKRKNAVKSVIKRFETKINKKIENAGIWDSAIILKVNFSQFLSKDIETDEQIDEIYEKVRQEYLEKLQKIKNASKNNRIDNELKNKYSKLLEELKNTKITNEEVIEQLEQDGILSYKEVNFLKDSKEVSDLTDQQMAEVYNIFSTLFNSSIVNVLDDFMEIERKVRLSMERFQNMWKVWDVIAKKIEQIGITNTDVENIYKNKLEWKLTDSQLKELEICEEKKTDAAIKDCEYKVKEKLVKDYILWSFENLWQFFLDKGDKDFWNIILKIAKKEKLDEADEKILYDEIKDQYIDNVCEFIFSAYKFKDDAQKNEYKEVLKQILDLDKDKIKFKDPINWWEVEVDVEKKVIFNKEYNNINELFEEQPYFELKIKDSLDIFKSIYPYNFVEFNLNGIDISFSRFQKVKVNNKDGTSTEWYLKDGDDGTIFLCEDKDDDEKCKELNLDEISDIQPINNELILNNHDLPKLFLSLTSNITWKNPKLIEQTSELLNKVSKDIEKEPKNTENVAEKLKEFNRIWKKLNGDEDAQFEKGSVITLKWVSLNIPWFLNNWFYAEIVDINKETGTVKLKIKWWVLNFSWETEYTLPIDAEWLKKLKRENGGNVFRFKKLDDKKDFVEYVKELELTSNFQWFSDTLWKWKNSNLEAKSDGIYKKWDNNNLEKVEYIGRAKVAVDNNNEAVKKAKYRSDLYDVWKLEYNGDQVTLKDPETWKISKTMDYNTFMLVFLQNDLSPWTGKEYRWVQQNFSSVAPKAKAGMAFALNDIILAVKNIKDSFMYHFKQDDELRAAIVYSNLTKVLPWWWFFSDVKLEANGERESKIWNVIESYKSRLERSEWEWKWWNHAKTAAWIIEKEIFKHKNIKKWKALPYRHRLKAAWYLLYALDKWPWPYFRALSQYNGQWMWIKALLWPQHYYKWQTKVQELKDKIKQDPENQNLRSQLVMSEMFYLKDEDTTWLFSSKFWPTVEFLTVNAFWDSGKEENAYKWESEKGSYSLIYDGWKSYVLNDRPSNASWALKALVENVDSQSEYVDFNKVILSTIFTWFLYNSQWTPYVRTFDKICRTYSIPIWLFAKSYYGHHNILHILDYIVAKKWIKPWGKKQSFTQFLYGKKNPEDVDITNYTTKPERAKIMWKMESFWNEYGEEIVFALDYTDTTLLDATKSNYEKDEVIATDKQKQAIGKYLWKVNAEYKWESWEISKTFVSWEAPYYQEGIFNIAGGVFEEYACKVDDGNFEHEIWRWMWEGLVAKLESMQDFVKDDNIYEFVLKRFMSFFGNRYKWKDNRYNLIKAIQTWNEAYLKDAIVEHLKYSIWGHYGEIPPEMEEWLEKFAEVLWKRPSNINNVLKSVFSETDIENAMLTPFKFKNMKSTNNLD